MAKTILKINTPNKMITVNGRMVRTPCHIKIKNEQQLNFLKSSMQYNNISDFIIEEIKKEKPEQVIVKEAPKPKKKKLGRPKKKKKPETTLGKILGEDI